ncbi:hypothetical protein BH11PLA1_BH11PLA1_17230 [soil metagenome]
MKLLSNNPNSHSLFNPVTSGTSSAAPPVPGPATPGGVEANQSAFAAVMARSEHRGTAAQRARTAAEEFVSVALVQPILKQLRETDGAAAPFNAGPAEKQFRAMLDSAQAQQIVKAKSFPLVDRLAQSLAKGSA